MNALDTELKTYQRLLPSLLAEQGKFVLISGETLLGTYAAYEDALQRGYEQCGIKPFLVKKIAEEEQVFYFTRDLGEPCRA